MKERHLILGMGEVGKALAEVLSIVHDVETKDIEPKDIEPGFDVLHVCLRHSSDFLAIVGEAVATYKPALVDVCSTVPPGTTEKIGRWVDACHSTTRGLHPNLVTSLLTFVKHIGGPRASDLERSYAKAGVRCATHATSRTTELAHILSNVVYGVNLQLSDELAHICRAYGVDYQDAVLFYNRTSNEGFEKLGVRSKHRMLLNPPQGKIGGHCVVQGAKLLEHRGHFTSQLASA